MKKKTNDHLGHVYITKDDDLGGASETFIICPKVGRGKRDSSINPHRVVSHFKGITE